MSERRSILVTFAAQALSITGFSVSILAWLVLSVVPLSKQPPLAEPIAVDKKARRRSAPAALQRTKSPSPSSSTRSPVETSLIAIPDPAARKRKVYFADSPVTPSRPTPRTNDSAETLEPILLLSSPVSEVSPASSSSTLVHSATVIPSQTLETCRESAVESDSSSSSSQRRSLSLSRPFQPRARRSSGSEVPLTSNSTSDGKQPRRSSANFIPPFSFRRTSTKGPASVDSPVSASSTVAPLAPSYFSRKATRRTSTPVPRTQPYAYPYFAQPPDGSVDDSYLQARSPTPDLPASFKRSATVSDSESAVNGVKVAAATRSRKSINDKAQAALGLGRRPSTPRRSPQQRSVSEGWVDASSSP
ncbi:hypothetical protein MKEN_01286300 [Mycena kentingensis (nom. inval.)]|nr:hypothetical protein MKEN_01286300 [Mycena kentingensis (nom. inval.)]